MRSLVCGFLAVVFSGSAAAQWDAGKAAAYLDGRIEWWMDWQTAQRDHETFCVSCHTAAPYAVGRSALRGALDEKNPSADERRLLDNVTRRVRMWNEVAPFYADSEKSPGKTAESRGTEAVFNALILSWNDRASGTSGTLSADARKALDNMWSIQLTSGPAKGAWAWLQFHNAPWEGDSQFYGAALAAVAVGNAPGNYRASQEIQEQLHALEDYLARERESQKLIDKLVLLWASARLPGLLTAAQQKQIVAEAVARQRADGGFSLSTFVGDWKRKDNTPLEAQSDGYATAVAVFAMEQAGVKPGDPAL